MDASLKPEGSATGFSPHIEELHEFFRSRKVAFGAPEDLPPFMERLTTDAGFRDEMASMVRAILYRERDGLTPVELLELLMTAVGGVLAEDAPEQIRDTVRQMMSFLGGVFRSRWNPGGSAAEIEAKPAVEAANAAPLPSPVKSVAEVSVPVESAERPMTPIFYQAQVMAHGGEEPAEMLPLREVDEPEEEVVGPAAAEPVPAPVAVQPAASFLRTETAKPALPEPQRDRSRGWMWAAITLAVVLAFCAGIFAREWGASRSDVVGPVTVGPAPAATSDPSAALMGTAHPPNHGEVGRKGQGRQPARVEAARSEWRAYESASDLAEPGNGETVVGSAPSAGAGAARGTQGAGSTEPAVTEPAKAANPEVAGIAKPSPAVRADVARPPPKHLPGIVGVSPGMMGSHLLYAPEPDYPDLARMAHIQGRVVVEAEVGIDGDVVWARAISGHRLLRGAAERSVYERHYRPYTVGDQTTAVQTLVTVDFRLPK